MEEKLFTCREAHALQQALEKQISELDRRLQDRYEAQTKAVDAAFVSQQVAMVTAMTAADRAVQAALESTEKAIIKSEIASDKRFSSVNEFRGQLTDQAATFVTRREHDTLVTDIQSMREALAETRGKASQNSVTVAYIIGFIGLALSLVSFLLSIYDRFPTP